MNGEHSNPALVIDLPEDVAKPPRVSKDRFRVPSGSEVNFVLRAAGTGDAAGELRFRDAAFQDSGGQPLRTLKLKPGNNRYTARDCKTCAEYKYDIVDTGDPGRPHNDPWIIIDPPV